jgi:hypothetical protein
VLLSEKFKGIENNVESLLPGKYPKKIFFIFDMLMEAIFLKHVFILSKNVLF